MKQKALAKPNLLIYSFKLFFHRFSLMPSFYLLCFSSISSFYGRSVFEMCFVKVLLSVPLKNKDEHSYWDVLYLSVWAPSWQACLHAHSPSSKNKEVFSFLFTSAQQWPCSVSTIDIFFCKFVSFQSDFSSMVQDYGHVPFSTICSMYLSFSSMTWIGVSHTPMLEGFLGPWRTEVMFEVCAPYLCLL